MSGADCAADAVAEPYRPFTQYPRRAQSGERASVYGFFRRSVAALAEGLAAVFDGAEVLLSLARAVHWVNHRHWFSNEVFLSGPCLAVQYTTALSATCAGEPVPTCALPRASSQPSERSRRATIRRVGDAAKP
jgi:hypothetical protein